jgi:hypothetical protein
MAQPVRVSRHAVLTFDTGTDKNRDQIIEISSQRSLADDSLRKTWRFAPNVPMT